MFETLISHPRAGPDPVSKAYALSWFSCISSSKTEPGYFPTRLRFAKVLITFFLGRNSIRLRVCLAVGKPSKGITRGDEREKENLRQADDLFRGGICIRLDLQHS